VDRGPAGADRLPAGGQEAEALVKFRSEGRRFQQP
jgi:hypothetical protein